MSMSTIHHDRYSGIFTPTSAAATAADGQQQQHSNSNNNNCMVVVSPGFETQTLLESLYPVSLEDVGSDKFMAAYCVNLERLSIQAHWTAGVIASAMSNEVAVNGNNGNGKNGSMSSISSPTMMATTTPGLGNVLSSLGGGGAGNEEEYIVEAFLENGDKLEAIVKTLLALELWRENVLFVGGRRRRRRNMNRKNGAGEENEEDEFEIDDDGEVADHYHNLNEVDGGGEEEEWANGNFETRANGLAHRLAANGNALRMAFILHAETSIVSLLNLIFYKGIPAVLLEGSSVSAGGDDLLLSLVDYCARRLIFLGTPEESNPSLHRQKNPLPASQLSEYLQSRSRINEIKDSIHGSTYQTAIASVALSQYLCESISELGPSLLSRVLEVHDFPLLMVPLIEEPPWTRRRLVEKRGKNNYNNNISSSSITSTRMIWEKLDEHNEWNEVQPSDLLRLTKVEGQPWLALFHLTTSKASRESYGLDEYRKSQLMKLRKYIQQALMDQLPVLGDVARYLDELSILGVPPAGQGVHRPSSNASSSGLLLQRVDSVRESIIVGGGGGTNNSMQDDQHWERIAQKQWEEIFSHLTDSEDGELRRIASEVYGGAAGLDDNHDMTDNAMNGTPASDGGNLLNEKPQSTVEDCKVTLSKPIEKVTLHLRDGDDNDDSSLTTFELVPLDKDGIATTDTPLGTFRRLKMSISQTGGDGDAIFPHARIDARIQFQSSSSSNNESSNQEVLLSIDSLDLPTTEHSTSQNSYDEVGITLLPEIFPLKEWRQLGNIEERSIVLQLGFKRLSRGMVPAGSTLLRGYSLSLAFVSQPVMQV